MPLLVSTMVMGGEGHKCVSTSPLPPHTHPVVVCLPGLEEEDRDLAKVEVEEVLGLMGDVRAEVTANDAMPGGVVLLIELLLDVGSDVLLDVELLHGLGGHLNGVGLHVLGHIGVLDHGLAVGGSH
jgi:hypothetical protein